MIKKPNLIIVCIAVSVFVSLFGGCATGFRSNGYNQFYKDDVGGGITNCLQYSGTTKIIPSADIVKDIKESYRDGYTKIGHSAFFAPAHSDADLMAQAKLVGADVVVIKVDYLGSQQTVVPWITYNPGQSTTTKMTGTVTANAWGSGGYSHGTGNYNGVTTTETSGTYSTQAMPVTVHRYQYQAAFFRKHRPLLFGVHSVPTTDEIRKRIEMNAGLIAEIVETASPAFDANVLEGDVLLKMNGELLSGVSGMSAICKKYNGQKVELDIWRNGEFKKISVQLRALDITEGNAN